MILSKIILAATMSATVLWFMPMHSNGKQSVHQHCGVECSHDHCGADCDHDHCGVDCGHLDAEHAMPATANNASPDAHVAHSHSAVYAAGKEKCPNCDGKGKIHCFACDGKGKWKETCRTCNGKQVVRVPGKLTAQGCKSCGGTGKEKFECWECKGKGKQTCSKCNGKGKI